MIRFEKCGGQSSYYFTDFLEMKMDACLFSLTFFIVHYEFHLGFSSFYPDTLMVKLWTFLWRTDVNEKRRKLYNL